MAEPQSYTDDDAAAPEGLREYVQQQIYEMGYRNLSEADLEKYTQEFARLLAEKPGEDASLLMTSLSDSCFSDGAASTHALSLNSTVSETPSFLRLPTHLKPLKLSPISTDTRPTDRPNSSQSALYKEILTDQDSTAGTIQDITSPNLTDVSVTDLSLFTKQMTRPDAHTRAASSAVCLPSTASKAYKRKIANQKVQDRHTCKNAECISSDNLRPTTAPSLPRPDTSENTLTEDGSLFDKQLKDRGKSFIRPNDSALSSYRVQKHDPVSRYHEFRRGWQVMKAPGEKNRNQLRWVIREQLNYQNLPGNASF